MKFIHFGCWNNGYCDINSGTNGLSMTMRKLNQYLELNKDIGFMTIAGDNYYPDKIKDGETKIKRMNIENMISGINCLPKDIKKYILLGNHEYDPMIDESGKKIECISLIKQREEFLKQTSIFFNDIIHYIYNNTLIIMLDTTIYEFIQEGNILSPNKLCYDKVFDKVSFTDLIDIARYQ